MSQTAGAPSLWMHDDPGTARERLRKAVAALTRARHLQVLLDHAFGGLLVGLCLATVAVLWARLMPSFDPLQQLAGAAVLIALAVALLVGWWRRPDPLEVAIRADLTLSLKQRLSTAWEFMTIHGNDELTDRLAVQAAQAGLPARPWKVFPLRVNQWGRLAPLAATALLLVSIVDVDLHRVQAPAPQRVDEQVMGEGQRLEAFGRAMQARAERDKLPRSTRQAAQLERLGARMHSGALSRSEALGQLRQLGVSLDKERMQALAEANQTGGGARTAGSTDGSAIAQDLKPATMLERMQRGALSSNDTRALARRMDDLERLGIPRRELENALEHYRKGVNVALQEMLEKLVQIERALMEDKELRNALEQLRKAQDYLGDPRAGNHARRGPPGSMFLTDDEGDEGGDKSPDVLLDGATGGKAGRAVAAQGDSSVATDRRHAPLPQEAGPSGPVLTPQGQLRAGAEFASQGQIQPRLGRPSVENVKISAEFTSQVEAVISREHYPAHYKEFIRRYFLTLSQGAQAPQAQPPETRGAP